MKNCHFEEWSDEKSIEISRTFQRGGQGWFKIHRRKNQVIWNNPLTPINRGAPPGERFPSVSLRSPAPPGELCLAKSTSPMGRRATKLAQLCWVAVGVNPLTPINRGAPPGELCLAKNSRYNFLFQITPDHDIWQYSTISMMIMIIYAWNNIFWWIK